jgi:hypothetical protein
MRARCTAPNALSGKIAEWNVAATRAVPPYPRHFVFLLRVWTKTEIDRWQPFVREPLSGHSVHM